MRRQQQACADGSQRQAAAKNERRLASGPECSARVDALGSRPYYRQADIEEPGR